MLMEFFEMEKAKKLQNNFLMQNNVILSYSKLAHATEITKSK